MRSTSASRPTRASATGRRFAWPSEVNQSLESPNAAMCWKKILSATELSGERVSVVVTDRFACGPTVTFSFAVIFGLPVPVVPAVASTTFMR